jgi:hypothetical protein
MVERAPLCAERIRKITGGFAFIEHRFLRDGFFQSLNHHELLLYLFLVLVSDRLGLSYYSYDKICTLLRFTLDEYLLARDGLIGKDLVAFDGHLYQVLSLPDRVGREEPKPLKTKEEMSRKDPATVRRIILDSLGGGHG